MDSLIGQILDGRYRVESRIGQGAMGAVYKARHISMAQPVAIKFLLTDKANDSSMVERFIREARQSFLIDHPNCVRVTDFCTLEDGTLFIVMDYLDGRTVGREIAVDGPLTGARVRHIAAQAADALGHAHSLGLVHRDLKPDNIMLLQRGNDRDFTKIFDFGLAKLFDNGMMLTGLSMSPLTQRGVVFGTPVYMAPEQALGGSVGPASDVYTLGVCCYEMLTGTVPFEAATFTGILSMHVQNEPESPSARRPDLQVDPRLEDLVMACLRKDAAERPSTAELASALRRSDDCSQLTDSRGLASSETLILDQDDVPTVTLAGGEKKGGAANTDGSSGTSTASVIADPQVFRRPKFHYALLAVPLVALIAVVASRLGGSTENGLEIDIQATAAPKIKAPPPVLDTSDEDASAGEVPGVEAPSVPGVEVPSVPGAEVAGAAADEAPDVGTSLSRPTVKRPTRPNPHLAAAEAAFRSKEPLRHLKQLTEAKAALEAEPRNRRAAFLVGDALKKSGDKVRACRFFKRSSRKHHRANGCEN